MSLTTDRNDPDLTHGVDTECVPQAKKYLVLSEEERASGFVRPVRTAYVHTGMLAKYPLRDLTQDEKEEYKDYDYVAFEAYPECESPVAGRYWTQRTLDARGCGGVTTMPLAIAQTYARSPGFYGATYCVHCSKHLPVSEFKWEDGATVGS